jgi:trans-aconitate methyltransferase
VKWMDSLQPALLHRTAVNLATASVSYAIDERNSERQQLLAEMLNPLTRQVLDRVPRDSIARVLDLGCGHGHTTRMHAEQLPNTSRTGFEYDAALVA